MSIYLDYNASAPLRPAVKAAIAAALDGAGNPASVHQAGRRVRALVENARAAVAQLVAVKPAQVVFTSGGTEANNLALLPWGGTILYGATEHDSVRAAAGANARAVAVGKDGLIDLAALEQQLAVAQPPVLLAIMLVNNETGVIQPYAEIANLARRYHARLHCDAVQALGKLPLVFHSLGADSLTLSAHKIGGPQGCGALIVRDNAPLEPLLRGGGQEMRRRAGTENVLGIIGFGAAASVAHEDFARQPKLQQWRDALEAAILASAPDAVIVGQRTDRIANTSCVIMPGAPSATQLMAYDLAGFAVSSGAACSSGKVTPSHVLRAMGYDAAAADSAVRISLGWDTQSGDSAAFAAAWLRHYRATRSSAA